MQEVSSAGALYWYRLPVIADAILNAVRAFGKQIDDRTLLLIRRL